MAHKLEERFVNSQLMSGDIFEFGAGDCSWARSIEPTQVHTVDLYPPPDNLPYNVRYEQGNLLNFNLGRRFSNIVCLSSFEHAGIETAHFRDKTVDLTEINRVANTLANLVGLGGRIILTVPAGTNELYAVRDGVTYLYDGTPNFEWGFQTFTLASLLLKFPSMRLVTAQAYLRKDMENDYFNSESWDEIDPATISNQYNTQNALLCVCLETL